MDRIKRLSLEVLEKHKSRFGENFTDNKKSLDEVAIVRSKGLKNEIAGYITNFIKKENREAEDNLTQNNTPSQEDLVEESSEFTEDITQESEEGVIEIGADTENVATESQEPSEENKE